MAKRKVNVEQPEVKVEESKYSKTKILTSNRYRDKQDLISAVWVDDSEKTLDEIDELLETYMKGKVI